MSRLESALRELVAHLADLGARFAMVGGLAVSARTEPRFTRDADLCVAVEADSEAETLIRALRKLGYELLALVEQEATGRIATVRLVAAGRESEGVVLDLLFASSGIEAEIVSTSETIELFDGFSLPVATVPALLAQKVLARDDTSRPQDRLDIAKLIAIAVDRDFAEVEQLLSLIEARGFARRRDLLEDFRKSRDEFPAT